MIAPRLATSSVDSWPHDGASAPRDGIGEYSGLKLAEVRAALVVTGVSGALETQLMIQTADVSSTTPNPWQALGNSQQGARKDCENHDVTNYTDPGTGSKPMLARLGLSYNLASGSSEAYASVGVDVAGRWG